MVYETERGEEFSPVKNAEGADSPATCRRDQIRRAVKWLAETGVKARMKDGEPDLAVENISPLLAIAIEVGERLKSKPVLEPGQRVYLA